MEKYPSIVQLPDCPEIFSVKQVVATEKIHGCVVCNTRVSMADGSTKSISKLSIGDEVLGVDRDGRVVSSIVTKTYKNGKAERWTKVAGTLGVTEASIKGNVSKVLGPMYREMLTRE